MQRKPHWLRIKLNTNKSFRSLKTLVQKERLNTVCEEARCPNIHECWSTHKTATFMILGDTCTRRCRFCAVKTGLPGAVDWKEPERVARSIRFMKLQHVVITMVDRDDLKDGGALMMANTIEAIREYVPSCSVEVLTSDFMGSFDAVQTVINAAPAVMSHNIETVRRLTPQVRSRSSYERSLSVLRISKDIAPDIATKSSIMLGLGESDEEVLQTMDDLLAAGVEILNMGQYLQPSRRHLPVQSYRTPEDFLRLKEAALAKGFGTCDAGPLVRSSYHAADEYEEYRKKIHPLYQQ